MRHLAVVIAMGLGAGCAPHPVPDIKRPAVAPSQACKVRFQEAWTATALRAGSPRLEGEVQLVSARGDDRLRHAGQSMARWSEDGTSVVSVSADAVVVWDSVTGESRYSVLLGQGPGVVTAMAVSPTAKQVALVARHGGASTPLVLLVLPEQGVIRVLDHSAPPTLRFSADEARLIGAQQVWDVTSGKRIWKAQSFSGAPSHPLRDVLDPLGESEPFTRRAFTHWLDDGRTGIEIRREGSKLMLERWIPERSERTTLATFAQAPAGQTVGYALSPNGHFFIASLNGQARRWSLLDGSIQRLPAPLIDWRGKDIALSNGGNSLAFWTRRLKNMSFPTGPLFEFYPLPTVAKPFQMPCMVESCGDTAVHLWDLAKGTERWTQPHNGNPLVFGPSDTLLMPPTGRYGSTKVIDVDGGRTFGLDGHLTAIHPPSRRALVRRGQHGPRVVQLGSERSWPLRAYAAERLLQRSSTGATVTSDEQGRIRLRTADHCFVLPHSLNRTRFSNDGRWLFGIDYSAACRSKEKEQLHHSCTATSVTVWDADNGRALGAIALEGPPQTLRVLPSTAEVLVSGWPDQTWLVPLLEASSRHDMQPQATTTTRASLLPSVGGPPNALGSAWQQSTRDGRYLFGVRRANQLSLWDRRGGPAIDLPLRRGVPRLMTLSADNRFVAVVPERSNGVRWWRLPDQESTAGPDFGSRAAIDSLLFNPNSSTLAVVKRDAVHLVDVATGTRTAAIELRQRYDSTHRVTWTGPHTLTIDTARGVEIVVDTLQ